MKRIFSLLLIFCIIFPIFVFGDDKNLEDGLYKVNISLWHAYEDKASMGNPSIEESANIFVKDGESTVYIGVRPLTFANLTTSVTRFFYADNTEKVYKPAGTYVFEITIPNEVQKRPKIFSFPLKEKSEFYDVLIDPKVEQMGNEPIKARLKLDWTTLEKINENGSLYEMAINDKSEKPRQKDFRENGVLVIAPDFLDMSINISKVSRSALGQKAGAEKNRCKAN